MISFICSLIVMKMLAASAAENIYPREHYEIKFVNWLRTHNVIPENGFHFARMLENFANNDDHIEAQNSKNLPYKLGHNKFSHLDFEEWKLQVGLGGFVQNKNFADSKPIPISPMNQTVLPDEVDWVKLGAVTSVKDQGKCGSCWSFSTTGALEGIYQITYKDLVSFSEQNLVDCDSWIHGGKDHGCNGGLMDAAFAWVQANEGLCTEDEYPYESGDTQRSGFCKQKNCNKNAKVAPSQFYDVEKNSDLALMSALARQPLAIAIQADQKDFQLYESGVFTAPCGANLDHGVLAVGYGTENGVDYYKVKNSWGPDWGQDGYILLERGVTQKEGQCGILAGPPSYPVLG